MLVFILVSVFFFFKQKTAYEMRISDWSSDVCSSYLVRPSRQCQKLYQAVLEHDRAMRYQRSFRPPDFGLPFVLGRDQQHAVRIFPIQAQHKLGELARLDKIVVAAAILAPFGVLVATTEIGRHTSELQSLMRISYA